jgi:hypothetical protein
LLPGEQPACPAALLTQPLNHVFDSSAKLQRWYDRLCGYKKAGLVRTGLRRRVLAEILASGSGFLHLLF